MGNRRIEMHQYRQAIYRMRQGESDRAIAKAGLIGRTKCAAIRALARVKGWLDSGSLPDDKELSTVLDAGRTPKVVQTCVTAPYEEQIRQWVGQGIQATTIYQALVSQFHFTGSYPSVRRMVRRIRGERVKATCVLDFTPGEAAQVDFGKGPTIKDVFTGAVIKTWIFVITLCFSRHMYAEIVTDPKVATWLACHRRAFAFFKRNETVTGEPQKRAGRSPPFDKGGPGGIIPLSFRGACDEESQPSAIMIHFVLRRDPSLRSG
jgi:hypothetical protein